MLLLIAALYKQLAPWPVHLVADCHNKSLKRRLSGPLSALFFFIKRWSFQQTDAIIVSNKTMVSIATELTDRVLVMRDPLPLDFTGAVNSNEGSARDRKHLDQLPTSEFVLFVCSFERDEPIDIILESARKIANGGTKVVVTGDTKKLPSTSICDLPHDVQLCGFVPDRTYSKLLQKAKVVVALTNDHDCLMCAAYEALAAGKRPVISDTQALRDCFGGCAVYTNNSVADVTRNVISTCTSRENPVASTSEFVASFDLELQTILAQLNRLGILLTPRLNVCEMNT